MRGDALADRLFRELVAAARGAGKAPAVNS